MTNLDKDTVLYIADIVRAMVAAGDAGEIEETLRRLAVTLPPSQPQSDEGKNNVG